MLGVVMTSLVLIIAAALFAAFAMAEVARRTGDDRWLLYSLWVLRCIAVTAWVVAGGMLLYCALITLLHALGAGGYFA